MRGRRWHYAQGGREMGPVSRAELVTLLRTGQVKTDDLVWAENMPRWIPARDALDLWDLSSAETAPVPCAEPQTSGLAIASLVCGVLAIGSGVTGILAVVFGHMAMKQISQKPALYSGRGIAGAGLTLGYLSLLLFLPRLLALAIGLSHGAGSAWVESFKDLGR